MFDRRRRRTAKDLDDRNVVRDWLQDVGQGIDERSGGAPSTPSSTPGAQLLRCP